MNQVSDIDQLPKLVISLVCFILIVAIVSATLIGCAGSIDFDGNVKGHGEVIPLKGDEQLDRDLHVPGSLSSDRLIVAFHERDAKFFAS